MSETNYNGWTNYETWNVKLWLDNDQGSYDYWRDAAREALEAESDNETNDEGEDVTTYDSDTAASNLANQLKDELNDQAPDLGASCYADLLNAALSVVNWYEIAASLVEDAKEAIEA